MTVQERLQRINELSRLSREYPLTDSEKREQHHLRQEYIKSLRFGFRNMVEGLKVVDENNNDVTPGKLKRIQKEKGIHNR
ncbi:DUF896 domain-containing protein [Listeria rocourtiae]|uniref:DUF896 domain-containing protein n=1 Tax=Listeria rocourtiae TaxID=647910 RepID=UPI001626AD1C|nr:DUF896 domain-containing protein [Listeria rocourtiae]MBC1436294.1 DUF896 domain-containing protein [Listeria rocourtiae]